MPSQAPTAPSPPSSFAGYLATLVQPGRVASEDASARRAAWRDELLADDVATLSYEQALRAHSRYHADDPVADPKEPAPAPSADPPRLGAVPSAQNPAAKVLKEASITIRLSRDENAQLRRRAAEAGLSVSAYIRSCTFEAESLRALVKDTLTRFRAGGPTPQPDTPIRRSRWAALFWPGRRAAHHRGPDQA